MACGASGPQLVRRDKISALPRPPKTDIGRKQIKAVGRLHVGRYQRRKRDAPPKVSFAADSPLEERVSSEPVSEVAFSGPGNYGTIPRGLWMITEAEEGYFGVENGGI
jgi:hypothetical protein